MPDPIDWEAVNNKIEYYRKDGISKIEKALQEDINHEIGEIDIVMRYLSSQENRIRELEKTVRELTKRNESLDLKTQEMKKNGPESDSAQIKRLKSFYRRIVKR